MNFKRLILLGLVMVLALAAVPAFAQESTATPQPALTASTEFFLTSDFRVNVRSGPGTEYTVLGRLVPGDAVDITGRTEDSRWVRINFNGQEGWISGSLVDVTGDLETAAVAEAGETAVLRQTANQTTTTALQDIVVVTRFNSNLRAEPTTASDVLTVVPFDTTLDVIARTQNNNWVQVRYNDQTGWLSAGVLLFNQGNIANLPFLAEDGTLTTATPEADNSAAPAPESTPSQ